MTRLLPLLLAALLTFQTGCAHVSDNNRRGMLFAGGASMFIGGIIVADVLSCDEDVGASSDCDENRDDTISGLSLLVGGALLVGLAMYFKHRDSAAAPAPGAAQK